MFSLWIKAMEIGSFLPNPVQKVEKKILDFDKLFYSLAKVVRSCSQPDDDGLTT